MEKRSKKIVVCGDAALDVFIASKTAAPGDSNPWQTHPESRVLYKKGGSLLLEEFIQQAIGLKKNESDQKFNEKLEQVIAGKTRYSTSMLEAFPFSKENKNKGDYVYRVKEFKGYTGTGEPHVPLSPEEAADAGVIVIDDAGFSFRNGESKWKKFLNKKTKANIILKLVPPIAGNELLKHLQTHHRDRLVIVINANDLRQIEETKIDRCLSWERTAKEFVWQMASNPKIIALNNCAYLAVRFGVDGAILYRRHEGVVESWLYYDPKIEEDEFENNHDGNMQGLTACFTASLTAEIAKAGLYGIIKGVREGLTSSRKLYQRGFGKNFDELDYPREKLFKKTRNESTNIYNILIPNPKAPGPADPLYWSILEQLTQNRYEEIARNYVLKGKDDTLNEVPVGKFGNLVTLDRNEIESYRSIRNIIREYLKNTRTKRPLSLGVFGKPGSGKSFGVTEIAENIAPGKVEKIEFNLSQFKSVDELTAAFHLVRDLALGKKVPLVFFDEFDSSIEKTQLAWLKYFLAPMQDGVFREGDAVHPIGKAIFVFAGGTCTTFSEFAGFSNEDNYKKKKLREDQFKYAKGPDFLSRMRGFVDIKGPDPVEKGEPFFPIRRALILRSLLERKTPHLVDANSNAALDPGVLRAFLKVPAYKHGIRSIEAIIEMSMLTGRKSFEQSSLPSSEQLEMHVDPKAFSQLAMSEVLLGNKRDVIAKEIHEAYRRDKKGKRKPTDPSMAPWDKLSNDLKESNRQQADHIAEKLKEIKCDFSQVEKDKELELIEFSQEEIEIMARMEHERWNAERFLENWSLGKKRDTEKKISPYLVDWEYLPEDIRKYDREAVCAIPIILKKAGFEIYRLK